nr:MAG TPA: hypothetical protein [Caudoviricetes sp.]
MQPCNARESKASINADGAKRNTINMNIWSQEAKNEV